VRWVRGAQLIATAVALIAALPAVAQAAPAEPLRSEGRWIVDAQGRVVILHGVNMVTKRAPHLPSEAGWGADDAAFLASEGFNSVRLGFGYSAIEPAPGTYDTSFLEAYAAEAQTAADNGLLVLADVHQDIYTDRYQGNGLPEWMALDDGLANPANGFPGNYFTNPALNRSFDSFWDNRDAGDGTGLQDHYVAGLQRLAEELAGNSGVLGYDLFNEPWPGSPWADCFIPDGCPEPTGFDATTLTDFSRKAVDAIRVGDPNRLTFYEPTLIFGFGAPTGHGDPGDPNAGMSFHNYCITATASSDPPECAESVERVLDNADAHGAAQGDALLMTEFGATDLPEAMDRIADAADRHMVGWNYWTYSNVFAGEDFPSTSLIEDLDLPPTSDNVKQPAMDALARPYPQVVAGTPKGWSWDEAGKTFELTYSTTLPSGQPADAGAETEVFVPARHFPGGYRATAMGGEVLSGPSDRLLRVRACPGAPTVAVAVAVATPSEPTAAGCATGAVRCATFDRVAKGSKRRNLGGSAAGDRLVGDRRPNRLVGRAGDDCLNGKSGDDRLSGGPGNDTLKGGAGADRLKCGRGRDAAWASRADRVSASCEKVRRKQK
jgi:endoglycosylceramidase